MTSERQNLRKEPRISIITVTLNDLQGLQLTCASIEKQTYNNIEHVVVDGASRDGTPRWLAQHGPRYPFSWASETDAGIYDAMNKGVARASGDLIVFMNSADRFTDADSLSFVAREWVTNDWYWGFGEMNYVDESGNYLGRTRQAKYDKRQLELGLAFAPHQATYISRSFFQQLGGFDLAFHYASDQEFAIRAGKVSPPRTWPVLLADFLPGGVHSQSTYWNRERLYHKMRQKNGVLLAKSAIYDRSYAEVMGTFREVRELSGKIARKLRMKGS